MNNLIIFGAKYLYLLEIAILAIYFFLQPKNKQKSIIILSALFLPLAYIMAKAIAIFYFDPRPFIDGHFTPLIPHAPDNGFPSDHMLLGGAIASILFAYNKKLGAAAWVIAFLVGIARIYAGIHHLVDILGSALIAITAIWVIKQYIFPIVIKTRFYKKYFI